MNGVSELVQFYTNRIDDLEQKNKQYKQQIDELIKKYEYKLDADVLGKLENILEKHNISKEME